MANWLRNWFSKEEEEPTLVSNVIDEAIVVTDSDKEEIYYYAEECSNEQSNIDRNKLKPKIPIGTVYVEKQELEKDDLQNKQNKEHEIYNALLDLNINYIKSS